MIPYPYQIEKANLALDILRANGLAYLAMEERTGKTLTALLVAEMSTAKRVLFITKKKAYAGIVSTLNEWEHETFFVVTTYHQLGKMPIANYDLVIIDEAHNYISAYPKQGAIWKTVKQYTANAPILYLSATPHAQSYAQLFNQFALCDWSPWARYRSFYQWHNVYGIPYTLPINGINVPQYDKVKTDKVRTDVDALFVTATRASLGFQHEPVDVLHYIEPSAGLRATYNAILEYQIAELSVGTLVCDSASKLRTALHQLEGGTIKIDETYHTLPNTEKVDYILAKWGDNESLVIMYHFKEEEKKLRKYFKHATILQATSYAEGVDLYGFDNLVIYSQDYSTARHTQRRARQANAKRDKPIEVHFLLIKKAISAQVYRTVCINKKNFVDSRFSQDTI